MFLCIVSPYCDKITYPTPYFLIAILFILLIITYWYRQKYEKEAQNDTNNQDKPTNDTTIQPKN